MSTLANTVCLLKPLFETNNDNGGVSRAFREGFMGVTRDSEGIFTTLDGSWFATCVDGQWEVGPKNAGIMHEEYLRLFGILYPKEKGDPMGLPGDDFESAPIKLVFWAGKPFDPPPRDSEAIVTCHGFAIDGLDLVDLKDRSVIATMSGTMGWSVPDKGSFNNLVIWPDDD